jgi:hypothetical protein
MIPTGYMAKRVSAKTDWLNAPQVTQIFSVSSCISEDFADYIQFWAHNGYWLFNSPLAIQHLAQRHSISLDGCSLFYYEVHDQEFTGETWKSFGPEPSLDTTVKVPEDKTLEGFDVVTFFAGNAPECSPLSCNSLAVELQTNTVCLFDTLEQAEMHLNNGAFRHSEPGSYRIFAVYSVSWP